jgi:hypothetical protein
MEKLQEFQAAIRQGGFVEVEECEGGTVLWFRKAKQDAATQTHQRICIDSDSKKMTVYWMAAAGKVDSKTFGNIASLEAWMVLHPSE